MLLGGSLFYGREADASGSASERSERCGLPPGVASVRKGKIWAELRTENFAEPFAMLCIARPLRPGAERLGCRPGTRRLELARPSSGSSGGWPRGRRPLGCDLCLLSVALQKVGAPAARAGERKEIDSPREGWAPTGDWEASPRGSAAPPSSWRQRNAPTGRFAGHSGEKAVVEAQVAALVPAPGRRPKIPSVTDVTQCPVSFVMSDVAEARGRATRTFCWVFLGKRFLSRMARTPSGCSWRQRNGKPYARLSSYCG